ncbi:MAG: hypothetical protein A2Y12_05390 [Planctomycetes bacterium GWF2_42_9]|nr:MAG: hypothetical protein A2Y12_05390 [Planctomycetes bacterium GWF2_42_9]
MSMSLRDKVETVLKGGVADQIPFTIYESKLPQCFVERKLRNAGLCIVQRHVPVYKTKTPNVEVKTIIYNENDKTFSRTEYQTPQGVLYTISEPAGFTSWTHKRLFTTPDDYKPLLFMINDIVFESNYEAFEFAQKMDGGDSFFRGNIGLEPLQTLISDYMGAETFCTEWFDNRDEILKLYEALVLKRRQLYPLCANSPALAFNYGGNVTPEILGLDRFEKYYVPHYNEAADILHKKGKLIGVHFDGNCKLIAESIARANLDYIEAFTPAPGTDMTLAEARKMWPGKVLWINFPSAIHLEPVEVVHSTTEELMHQMGMPERFIMGITEDIPADCWQKTLSAIAETMWKRR